MARIKLDLKDRLMLSNQYKILEALYPDEADSYASARDIVENGYELSYDSIVGHLDPDPMPEGQCLEVIDILEMYRRLGDGYEALDDKSGIKAHDVTFMGFDGNNESAYLSYHQFLMKQRKWEESPARNSHMPTLDGYRRMLKAFQPFRDKSPLDKSDIQQIIAARPHPDARKV
jgi:uncharacterized protein